MADPYLKTVRAKIHLDALREELRLYRDSEPVHISREDDIQNLLHIVRFDIKPVPDPVPLILGDCLYCIRSSLDQLVWALAKKPGSYPTGTQFPIFDKWNTKNESTFSKYTSGIPTGAVSIIKSLQPHHGRDTKQIRSHLLWRLNKLCNIDKHRRVPVRGDMSIINFPDFPPELVPQINFHHDQNMVSVPLHLKSNMTFDPTGSIDVIFGDSFEDIHCNFEGLESIYEFVANNVLPRFARFF